MYVLYTCVGMLLFIYISMYIYEEMYLSSNVCMYVFGYVGINVRMHVLHI